jgi:hypothetical protein
MLIGGSVMFHGAAAPPDGGATPMTDDPHLTPGASSAACVACRTDRG